MSACIVRTRRRAQTRENACHLCRARSRAGRRRVQLAAAADVVRHRSERTSFSASAIAPRVDLAGVGTKPAGSLRSRRRQPDARSTVEGDTRRALCFGGYRCIGSGGCERGIYTTNGAVLTLFRRSSSDAAAPDLFCMALLAHFRGYRPGYSATVARDLNYLTWVVLRRIRANRAGTVTLRSSDPRDLPQIDFNYFSEGGEADAVPRRRDSLRRRVTDALRAERPSRRARSSRERT